MIGYEDNYHGLKAYVLVGESQRLPRKHEIEVIRDKRLIDLVVENLLSIGLDVKIFSKNPIKSDVPVIIDTSSWILESMINLLKMDTKFFVFGGDMPLVMKEAVNIMLDFWDRKYTLVPRWSNGYLEPLHAIYTRASLPCLEKGRSLTTSLLNCKKVKFLSAENMPKKTFFNVNTEKEIKELRKTLFK